MEFYQTELSLGVVIADNPHAPSKPQYDPYWDELLAEPQSTCESVGEQVKEDTKKTAPQHDIDFNHWVEKYWVERATNKYWYYRYMWMEGRKLRRKYIGSTSSARAKGIKREVDEGIRNGLSPSEITTLINHFSTTTQTH